VKHFCWWITGGNASGSMVSMVRIFPKPVFIKPNRFMISIRKLSEDGNMEIDTTILTDTPIEFKISDENIFQ
jgi:hypothetical protein